MATLSRKPKQRRALSGLRPVATAADLHALARRRFLAGERLSLEELAAELASGRGAAPHESLTNREHEVMILLASGHTASQVAAQLGLSVKTVSTHRTRLLAKMELTTNAELVRYALSHGLIT